MRQTGFNRNKALTIFISCFIFLSACSFNQPSLEYIAPSENEKFWIGDVGPITPGPKQYPFVCMAIKEDLGQALIDNQDGIGSAVFRKTLWGPWIYGSPIGYSRDCSLITRIDYYYYSTKSEAFILLEDREEVPQDVERIIINGKEIDFVVRAERGTINRFFYSIAMLAPYSESLDSPSSLNNSAWNKKLVYKFQGGVGIGHWQGRLPMDKKQALHYPSLKRGFAIAFSSGTSTASHYNLKLAEETALMVKKHFEATYGVPRYTVGIGGSGGGIQQYILGQNNKTLLDAAIPQLSFPDMVTQISYVLDCDLLERYFDEKYQATPDSKWGDWKFRAAIQGVSANTEAEESGRFENPHAPSPGASTCSKNWRGHTQNIMNPRWAHPAYKKALEIFKFPEETHDHVKWTHWNDLAPLYPQDENGYPEITWDNVGVQYGLRALQEGILSMDEFLELNACVGSWKPLDQQRLGDYPWDQEADPDKPDHWDAANMQLSANCRTGKPAPRFEGSQRAVDITKESGHLFRGDIHIPIIDVRWYLDPILDIHHAYGSFSARARIAKHNGNANNQLIWFVACKELDKTTLEKQCPHDPTADALDTVDQWLTSGKQPDNAVDACFGHEGEALYSGPDVWNGILDNKPNGACSEQFPVHTTSRLAAGEPITGEILKCRLKSVSQAIKEGDYGKHTLPPNQQKRLEEIFPQGVCNYF